jgi:hypothetical protein
MRWVGISLASPSEHLGELVAAPTAAVVPG